MNCCYLIQAGNDGPVLLGMVDHRHATRTVNRLQKANAELLHVRALLDGDERLERRLHVAWAEHRIRGDWYRPAVLDLVPDDVAVLGTADLGEDQRLAAAELAELAGGG